MTQRLRFYCRATAQVTDPHAQERGIRRCIGRRWQEVTTGRWAWVPSGKAQEVDSHPDLVKACQDGDLWPADEATAKICGVGFDPKFGDELTESIKAKKAQLEDEKKKAAEEEAAKKKASGAAAGGKGDG